MTKFGRTLITMYSKEHQKYLKKIKITNFLVRLTQISIITLFIFIWQYAADNNLINTFIASSPKSIIETIVNLYKDGTLFYHIWITFYEVIISFLIGTVGGIIIATILWRFKFISKVIDPYLTILNSLPKSFSRTYYNYHCWCQHQFYYHHGFIYIRYCNNNKRSPSLYFH